MDISMLVSFLAHGTLHEPFDEFLTQNGITKRPKKRESTEWITDKTHDITLEFFARHLYDTVSLVPRKSDGNFVLRQVNLGAKCRLPLPYGLSLSMSLSEVEANLGPAKSFIPNLPVATFVKDGLKIVINWNTSDRKNSFISFSVPNVNDKERLGL